MDDFQYPARLEIHYREKQSRISAFFRLILALPALKIVSILVALIPITHFLAGVWIVILGFYPKWLFDINLLLCRLDFKTLAYLLLLIDEYPCVFRWKWDSQNAELGRPKRWKWAA